MNGENQRIALTRRLLKEGLLQLLRTKSLEKINVSELCRTSGINRSTFYKHYGAPGEVLLAIEKDVVEDLKKLTADATHTASDLEQLEIICRYLYQHADLIRTLIRCSTDENAFRVLLEMGFWNLKHDWESKPELDPESVKLAFTFIYSGTYKLICEWIMAEVPKTPEEIAALVFRIIQ